MKNKKPNLKIAILFLLLVSLLSGCAKQELYTLREQAVEAYKAGNWQEAKDLFDQALSYGNGQVAEAELDILKYRAECELRLKDYEAAKNTCAILMELDETGDSQRMYADLQDQFEKVEKLTEALDLMEAGEYEKAYTIVDAFAGLGGDAASQAAWYNKAVCTEYMGNWDTAEELFADYIAIYPEDTEAQKEYEFCKTR